MKGERQGRWYRSTRFRITAPAALIVAVVVSAGSIFLVQSVKQNQLSQIDGILSGTAQYTRHDLSSLHNVKPDRAEGRLRAAVRCQRPSSRFEYKFGPERSSCGRRRRRT